MAGIYKGDWCATRKALKQLPEMQSLTGCATLQSLRTHLEHWPRQQSPPQNQNFLDAFLVLGLPELSSAEDFCAVETYVRTAGRRDELPADGRTERALMFWVYPARMWGPCRETVEKATGRLKRECHGLFMTVEQGVMVQDVVQMAKENLSLGELRHVHVAAR